MKRSNEGLVDIIKKEFLDEEGLRKTALDYSQLYFEGNPKLTAKKHRALEFDYQRRIRTFLIQKVVNTLHIKNNSLNSIIECGTSGDISCALAFPNSKFIGVDIEPEIFSNEINYLPEEWFKLEGIRRIISFYSEKKLLRKREKIIQKCLPNYERVVADGINLNYKNNSFDFALVQGTPDMFEMFSEELSRLLKPKKYLVSIVIEECKPSNSPSFYATGKYVEFPEHSRTKKSLQKKLGLEKIRLPNSLKKYETLCTWKSGKDFFSTGFVFEIFRKK